MSPFGKAQIKVMSAIAQSGGEFATNEMTSLPSKAIRSIRRRRRRLDS